MLDKGLGRGHLDVALGRWGARVLLNRNGGLKTRGMRLVGENVGENGDEMNVAEFSESIIYL